MFLDKLEDVVALPALFAKVCMSFLPNTTSLHGDDDQLSPTHTSSCFNIMSPETIDNRSRYTVYIRYIYYTVKRLQSVICVRHNKGDSIAVTDGIFH